MIDENLTLTETGFIYAGRRYDLGSRAILLKNRLPAISPRLMFTAMPVKLLTVTSLKMPMNTAP